MKAGWARHPRVVEAAHRHTMARGERGRANRTEQAIEAALQPGLWLNPSDNQGVRFLVEKVRAGKAWKEKRDRR